MKDNKVLKIVLISLAVIAIIIVLYLLIKYVIVYFLPFIIALLLAALIEPFVSFLERKLKFKRGLAVALALGLILASFFVLIFFGATRLFFELDRLIRNLPDFQEMSRSVHEYWSQGHMVEFFENWVFSPQLQGALEEGLETLYKALETSLKGVFFALQDGARLIVNIFLTLLISLIATFFMSKDKEALAASLNRFIPEKLRENVQYFKNELAAGTVGYIRARFTLIAITTFITIVALEAFGSNYSLLLGLLCGLLDLIPIVGPGAMFVPWAIYSFFVGSKILALQLIILYVSISVFRTLLEPKIIGQNIGVHPLATLISVYLGLKIFGAGGVFIGPALLITFRAFFRTGFLPKWKFFD